jgi:hypothetical protein
MGVTCTAFIIMTALAMHQHKAKAAGVYECDSQLETRYLQQLET